MISGVALVASKLVSRCRSHATSMLQRYAARAVVQEAKDAGVFVFAGGLGSPREASVVATHGVVTDGPNPKTKDFIGGFTVVDVPTRAAALQWAAKIAVACRCAQEVREFLRAPGR